jgi:hypothetical protein
VSDLREKLVAMAANHSIVQTAAGNRAFAIECAQAALIEYAEICERAKMPAAALGASLLATKLGKP